MIHSEDCKNCMYGYTIKCESGDEYIACDMQKCQEEKKEQMRKGKLFHVEHTTRGGKNG